MENELIEKLVKELNDQEWNHFELMKKFKELVLWFDWCSEKDFFDMIDNYNYIHNIYKKFDCDEGET